MPQGHSHGGGVCNCQQIWEAAYIPGHPINQVARRNGMPQHAIGEWLQQLYQEMPYGSASPYAHIIEEYYEAVEVSGLGEGGHGGHGRRGTQGGTCHGTQGGTRHGEHAGRGGHGGHGSRLQPPTGGRPNGTHGRRGGRTAPTETTESTLDPREAVQRERRQRRARAERRDAAEMDDMQKQMAGMGMGGGRRR